MAWIQTQAEEIEYLKDLHNQRDEYIKKLNARHDATVAALRDALREVIEYVKPCEKGGRELGPYWHQRCVSHDVDWPDGDRCDCGISAARHAEISKLLEVK